MVLGRKTTYTLIYWRRKIMKSYWNELEEVVEIVSNYRKKAREQQESENEIRDLKQTGGDVLGESSKQRDTDK